MANAFVTVAFVLLGLGFGALGIPLALGRVPPNGTYGFRTPKTLSSPAIWYAANRIQGIDLCIAGVVIAIVTLADYFAWRAAPAQFLALADVGILAVALTTVTVHGFLALGRL
jgi:uncharacterized membrane protein